MMEVESMLREAMEAADFVLTGFEARLDRAIGRQVRLALGRYASVVVLGAPIAWAVAGFHWERTSTYGLLGGVALYGLVDIVRAYKPTAREK